MEDSSNAWVKAVIFGCSLGLILGLIVAGALLWIYLSSVEPRLFPQAAPAVQPTRAAELILPDSGGSSSNDTGDLVAIDPDVPLPTETLVPTEPPPTQPPEPTAPPVPTETPLPLPTATPLPTLTPVPTQPPPPTATAIPPTAEPEQAIVVTIVPTESAAAPTEAPAEQTFKAIYTENQIKLTLEEIAAENSLPLQNIGVALQDGLVTISAEQFGLPSQFVTAIYALDGQLRVDIESATANGQPLPQELYPLLQTQIYAGLNNELRDEYNYTYLESITIQNGGLIVLYR